MTVCNCGSKQGQHKLGNKLCFRKLVTKDKEPKKFGVEKILWKLPKEKPISEFTLKEQRGYSYHKESDRWSVPKGKNEQWFESKGWD